MVRRSRTTRRRRRPVRRPARRSVHGVGRIRVVFAGILLVIAIIIVRLYSLQVVHGEEYRKQAAAQYTLRAQLDPSRGAIIAREKDTLYPLAINKAFALVYVVPRDIAPENREAVVSFLTDVLGDRVDKAVVRAKVSKQDDPYEVIARRVDDELAERIRADAPSGVSVQEEIFRYYPAGETAAQTVGFVGSDGETYRGRYGIEASFDNFLRGTAGYVEQSRDAAGRWMTLTRRIKQAARDGYDVILTIDYGVQYAVENILRAARERTGARRAMAVVLRPSDGAILAMASTPGFDPNAYNTVDDIGVFRNPIVSDAYEAGSVVKPITMAIGLDAGVITPETTYKDTGAVVSGGYTIRNAQEKVYGVQTMTQVLEKSINTGVIYVERRVGHQRFADMFARFGFGEHTDIRLPAEASGTIRNLRPPYRDVQFYTASFGQGVTMTLLQMAQAYAVIANDGMMMRPRVVSELRDGERTVQSFPPEERRRVISVESARAVREMLGSVVENQYFRRVKIPGYTIGGKTGTAQVARRGATGYREKETIHSFMGIAPLNTPQFVVAVRLDAPTSAPWSFYTAAPTFREIVQFLFSYYNIEPTEPVEFYQPSDDHSDDVQQ